MTTGKSYKSSMKEAKQRLIYLYLPSLEKRDELKILAEKAKMPLSKFIVEHVENSLKQEQDKEEFTSRLNLMDDLKKISEIEKDFLEETYLGVPLPDLLVAAGFEVDNVKSVKAVAADGYSVLYDSTIFTRGDVLVAYAKAEEPLSKDDGTFRMVLPGEEGTLNLRMLVEFFVEYK